VLIDGQNLSQYDPAELRRGVGYLPQEPELFTGTLGENLTIGAPRAGVDDIARALQLSGMDGFVATLPDGLGTFIGERGGNLSGGQRQGLSLARLILRRPRILFLDEPTNAMDRDMETQVTERLSALREDGTALILCTHRPGLAALAGRMVVLDKGRKVLDGESQKVLGRLQQAARARTKEGA
jgi:ATP-binding cassette subfamily C protein LapB